MSLPKEIFAPNIPIGHVQANGDVLMNSNWWLLIYNIVLNSIGSEGSIAPSGLIELAALDSDVNDTDSTSLRSPIANLTMQLGEEPLLQPSSTSKEALIALFSDDVPSLTYSSQLLLSLGATFINQTAPSNPAASRISLYSASSGSSAQNQLTTLDSNGVSLTIGFENHMVVYNGSGSDIAVGQLVYIAGSHATTPSIALAKADSATTLPAVGFTQYAIPNGSYGQIHVSGSVAATTTGFADGDEIYVSEITAGAFTKTPPSAAGQYVQQVGVVTNGGVGSGAGRLQFLFLTAVQAVRSAATGGTGQSSYTTGDLLYASSSSALSKLADVAAGSFLRSGGVSTAPAWSTITVPNAAVLGDLWYGSAASTVSALAGNITSTKNFLVQTGTGAVSAAPSWGTIATGDIPALGANPTASVGLTAVNGSATTYLRSDAAPALAVNISPTWTGTHIFNGAINTGTSTPGWSIGQSSNHATATLCDTSAGANAKLYRFITAATTYTEALVNDAFSTVSNFRVVTRSGVTLTDVSYGNATDNNTHTFLGTGKATFGGPVKTLSTTVASLPSASTSGSGARAFVTDATATTFLSTVAGGGANKVPVVSDGTNWLIG